MSDVNNNVQPGAEQNIDDNNTDQNPDSNTDQNSDAATLKAEIEKLRREAASYRTKLRDTEKALQANQPTLESANQRIADLESALNQMQAQALDSAIVAAATQLNFHDPNLATKLIDRDGLTPNDQTKIVKALNEIVKGSPFLVKVPRTDAGEKPAGGDFNMNNWIRRQVKR